MPTCHNHREISTMRNLEDTVAQFIAANALIRPTAGKNYELAALLGVLPGVGQIYLGQQRKGSLILLTFIPLCFLVVPIFLIPILSFIDCLVLSQRLKRGNTITQWECFWNKRIESREVLWEVSEIIKRGRAEQHIGVERRLIDNSRSSSPLVRNVTVRREYAYTYTVEYEHSQRTTNTKNMRIRDGATIEHSVEKTLQNRYAYVHDKRDIHEENIQVTVPPFKRFELILSWKNILEVGIIVLQNQHGERMALPFSIVVGLTFDQAQWDE
jgi:hypothetical protein